jgi:hypothetical protein
MRFETAWLGDHLPETGDSSAPRRVFRGTTTGEIARRRGSRTRARCAWKRSIRSICAPAFYSAPTPRQSPSPIVFPPGE